jgi:acetylglutamate kinase
MNSLQRAAVLSEALPYIKNFYGKTVIVKLAGSVLVSEELKRAAISDVVLLSLVGVRVVVVHGDGPHLDESLSVAGVNTDFKTSHRYTDANTLLNVQMLLMGKITSDITAMISEAGGKAIGMSGTDANLFTAKQQEPFEEYGYVGELKSIDPKVIELALDNGYVPVLSCIAKGSANTSNYLLNADRAAAELAVSMSAEKLILLSDSYGVCLDESDESTLISELRLSAIRPLIKAGRLSLKLTHLVECCMQAVRRGVPRSHILDGRVPHSIIVEMLTDSGIATMILLD